MLTKTFVALLAVSSVLTNAVSISAQEQNSKPNVVIVYADGLGYGDVGCYGATKVKTPNSTDSPPKVCAKVGIDPSGAKILSC